jgi:hypothetical protein
MPLSVRNRLFVLFVLLIVLAGALGIFQGMRYRQAMADGWGIPLKDATLFKADYWMGELVEAIVEKGRYRACYPSEKSAQPATTGICASAYRMPVVPLFMSLVAIIHNDLVFYEAIKMMIGTALLCLAAWLVLRQTSDWGLIGGGLVVIYALSPPNVQIFFGVVTEESYFIPQMALARRWPWCGRPCDGSR